MRTSRTQYYSGISSFSRPLVLGDINPPQYWFDAADPDTIVSSGNIVSVWSNKGTSNANNAATFSGSPTTNTVSSQNKLNLIGMGASGSFRFSGAFAAQARTRFYAIRPISNATAMTLLSQPSIANGDTISITSAGIFREGYGVTTLLASSTGLNNQAGTFAILTIRNATGSAASNRMSSNGNTLGLTSSGVATGYYTASITSNTIGSNFDIGEFISYNSLLTDTETFQIEGYLAWKWGVQSSMPINHPYKLSPPFLAMFNPTQISGCILWWDAADPSQFTGGSTWGDKSGTNNTGVNGTPGASIMPSVTTWTNGNRAARFVAGSKNSVKTTNTIPNRDVIYFLVARTQAVSGGTQYVMKGSADTYRSISTTSSSLPAAYVLTNNGQVPTTIVTANQSVPYILATQFGGAANPGTSHWTNGTQVTIGFPNALASTPSVHYYGSSSGDAGYSTVDIGEVIVYNNASLTIANRQTVEGYLAWKWGLQTSLPTTHPFRKVRP